MPETLRNPLAGKRIVITRAAAQSEALARELSARGAVPVVLPLVSFAEPEDFAPLDQAIAEIAQFGWLILTSAQAVRALTQRAPKLQQSLVRKGGLPRIACVGPVTAEAARKASLPVEYVAAMHNGVALANELGSKLHGAKVLLPRSDRANPDLPAALRHHGAQVTEVIAYRTLRPNEIDEAQLKKVAGGQADAILFFSPSAVQHFAELVGPEQLRAFQDKLAITAVGPVTANALHEAGVTRAVVAADTTSAAVIADTTAAAVVAADTTSAAVIADTTAAAVVAADTTSAALIEPDTTATAVIAADTSAAAVIEALEKYFAASKAAPAGVQ